MTAPRSVYRPVLEHEMHVMEWGDPALPPLVLWHGLARTGRDFDELAAALSDSFFVLCPDTIGRGLSSWSKTPEAHYNPAYYARLAIALLDGYGIDSTAWLGTSMGGLIGIHIAAGENAKRLNAFIINDIGPEIPPEAIERIVTYASVLPEFQGVAEAETWLRTVYAPFGAADDDFWRRMAETSVRRRDDGLFTLHYDPRIVDMMTVNRAQLDSWSQYERCAVPVHVLQGAQSDILTGDILERMRATGPRPGVTVFPDAGHAPSLTRPEDAALVRRLIAELGGARG